MIPRDNHIANELHEIIPTAEWPGLRPQPGETPAGYFDQLPGLIIGKIRAEAVQEELEMLSSTLAEIPRLSPFSVSDSYFAELPNQILAKIDEIASDELSSILATMPRITPMAAPAGYFEQLPSQLLNAVRTAEVEEELAALSPLLASLPRVTPMSVPAAGYFDELSEGILHRTTTTTPVIIRMRPRRSVLQWAVAACLIALVSTSSLLFMRRTHPQPTVTQEPNLADVSDQEIVDYLQTHMDAFDREELLSFAGQEAQGIEPVATPAAAASELPVEAIQKYLENTGSIKESPTED
jgi:hypothetical protein